MMKPRVCLAGCLLFTILIVVYNYQRLDPGEHNPLRDTDDQMVDGQAVPLRLLKQEGTPPPDSFDTGKKSVAENNIGERYPAKQDDRPPSMQIQTTKPFHQLFPHKLVHLDLKGAPPRISYYSKIFPLFKKIGVTGLLVEYEDMFPYWGGLQNVSAYNAYSRADIKFLQQLALTYNFEYIPLVQTFGHMEFALKLAEFENLRELPGTPQAICPSRPDSQFLVHKLIDQIMTLHPNVQHLHIGSDEVFHLAECPICQNEMATHQWGKEELFINHVISVAKYVQEKYSVRAIMWDDMFRLMPESSVAKSNISKYVDIMVWRYQKDIVSELPSYVWDKYIKTFSGIWVASAFKGATGSNQYLTRILHHLENHMSWVQTAEYYQSRVQFKGIAITGWQRYDHFAVLCELLPVAIPSLVVIMKYLQGYTMASGLISQATSVLDCNHMLTLDFYYTPYMDVVTCNYPGSRVFEAAQQLYMYQQEMEQALQTSYFKGWIDQYNIATRFSNPDYVMKGLESIDTLLGNMTNLQNSMATALAEVFDRYVVEEWMQTFMAPNLEKLNKLSSSMRLLLDVKIWPRRPLRFNNTHRVGQSHDQNSL